MALGADGVRAFADKVAPVGTGFAEAEPRLVGAAGSTRSPQNENMPTINNKWLHYRMVVGLQGRVPEIQTFLLDQVDLARGKPGRRHYGVAAFLSDPDDKISAAKIMKIIREGAERVHCGLRIPALLELHALGFDQGAGEQSRDINRKRHEWNYEGWYCGAVSQMQ